MDRFKTMQSFVRVAKSGSFSAAAEQDGYSRALLTKRIAELESRLGARLFNRTTRKVTLTEIGSEYLTFCTRVLDALGEEEALIGRLQNELKGDLRLYAPKSFGSMHFAECVAQFALAYPGLNISLTLGDSSGRSVNFADVECDVMIRLLRLRDSTVTARKIGMLSWLICASPEFLRRHGEPKHPRDLRKLNCMIQPKLTPDRIWRFGSHIGTVKVNSTFSSNSAVVLRQAAIDGVGIAQLPLYRVAADLKSGALKQVLSTYPLPDRPIFAVYPTSRLTPIKVKVFVDFMAKWYKGVVPLVSDASHPGKARVPNSATIRPRRLPWRGRSKTRAGMTTAQSA